MEIYTSYYSGVFKRMKKARLGGKVLLVQTSNTKPRWFEPDMPFAVWEDVFPPRWLVFGRGKLLGESEWSKKYREHLMAREAKIIAWVAEQEQRFDAVVLLCYEKPGDFCHRQILAEFLAEKGYLVKGELGEDDTKEMPEQLSLFG